MLIIPVYDLNEQEKEGGRRRNEVKGGREKERGKRTRCGTQSDESVTAKIALRRNQ